MSSYRLSDNKSIFNRYIQQYIKEATVDTTQFAPSNPDLAIQELENYIETLKKDTSVPQDVKDSQIKQAQAGIKQLQSTTKPAAANPFDQMAANAGLGSSASKPSPQELASIPNAGQKDAPKPVVTPTPAGPVTAAGVSAGANTSSEDNPEGDVTFKAASPVAVPVPGAAAAGVSAGANTSSEDNPEGDVVKKQAPPAPPAPPRVPPAPQAQQKAGSYTPEQLAAFKKAHASNFDPNSSMDRAKMAKMTGGAPGQPQAPTAPTSPEVRRAIPTGNNVQNSQLPGVAGTASNIVGRAGDTLQNLFRGQLGKGQQRRATSISPINIPKPGQIRR